MYTFSSRIRYSEVDSEGILTLESLIDYFQDCSTFQTQDGPATMEYLKSLNLAWVLNSWQIEIKRYPKLCEEVVIGTVPYELKGALGLRNFFMDTKDGERLAVANSIWTLFNFKSNYPARITSVIQEAYPLSDKLEMNYGDRKIKIPSDGIKTDCEEIVVRRHNLDTNNHVNNGQYIRMAIDQIKDKKGVVSSMRAEYKRQARLGDILKPVVIENKNGDNSVYTVNLNNKDDRSVCTVELIVK
ncbi:MAG: acyl-[acyl-carrier-protein] thioesterase [Butyrivibrio sp.]|uniref:acyl-[acyl-carrier-protein] thioesterase n=1 Tax=Butyrivibrio sp. TaxID=28121 RepID=UPI001B289A9A|nr:acyl-ACP thioesterase domain-containing protein [Butyrivibrio sp.]MBO6242614.1 acyl-[acyl-carrier-protein] thioesterase [Butyrivibrio sp.]